jgi:SAM-dependent MidA family methyltransferase
LKQVVEKILREIRNRGAISFARFMECALYCPVYGFYEKEEDTIGRRGDYFTSVSVGPLFGELLALQFAEWLEKLPASAGVPLQIVEAGAHRGDLARDILTWLRAHRPGLAGTVEYCIVEPSSRRREWQRHALRDFILQARWVASFQEIGQTGAGPSGPRDQRMTRGVVFSNELLDALPVHRLGWDAGRMAWFEWGVTFSNDRFCWTRLTAEQSDVSFPDLGAPGSGRFLAHAQRDELTGGMTALPAQGLQVTLPRDFGATPGNFSLPDGFILDFCPAASRWWAEAARALECGRLLAIDYGLTGDELFSPERSGGTLRAYSRHHVNSDVLANPGEQDLTAHVNFSELRQAGEAAGLQTEAWSTQERFLTRIAAPVLRGEIPFGEWTAERTRQFQTLTHPNHLGRSFRVLVQCR